MTKEIAGHCKDVRVVEAGLKHLALSLFFAASALLPAAAQSYTPPKWTQFVPVQGQSEPVPVQWVQDKEARIAHSLQLPDTLPKPVPFDFRPSGWMPWFNTHQATSRRYFEHLCSTEAGQWIFKTVKNVEGFYFARPQTEPSSDALNNPHGLEAPWVQRSFLLTDNTPLDQGIWFIQPPHYNYRFVEQPRREVKWQTGIQEPFVRLYGYIREPIARIDGLSTPYFQNTDILQVIGIPRPTARYGYTWRGLKRPQDREHGIAGGEVLIYDLQTQEVLAVRRQFLIATHGLGKTLWETATACPRLSSSGTGAEFAQFAFDVLQTIEPSTTEEKP